MLDIHAVGGFGPETKDDQTVDYRGDGEGKVVVLEPLGSEPEK